MNNMIVLTPMVLGIVQAFKKAGMPSDFSPILAMVIGAITYVALEGLSPLNVITGVAIGLSSVGLYTTTSKFGDTGNVSEQEIKHFKNR